MGVFPRRFFRTWRSARSDYFLAIFAKSAAFSRGWSSGDDRVGFFGGTPSVELGLRSFRTVNFDAPSLYLAPFTADVLGPAGLCYLCEETTLVARPVYPSPEFPLSLWILCPRVVIGVLGLPPTCSAFLLVSRPSSLFTLPMLGRKFALQSPRAPLIGPVILWSRKRRLAERQHAQRSCDTAIVTRVFTRRRGGGVGKTFGALLTARSIL